ncbi:type II pantothenate kinase [Bacillus sp. EB106-08-02-XG196]|jgi:type II pantothenate kinase|uniref:type II pantothenate kinase n=1 Tax=Bacillus sp. EB106-08-02-XG196 TaxID=2737049 RepID=UPI0015C49C7A|nr:type II pantothenate kinase [Bacillus sp. EB106-08-02-XG196]NWQ41631.1 type II pantothenate kinase [Bacillus sp. EB106-08-02-XG196]
MQQITAGIDAGGSLIKIVYQENGRMHFKKFSINKLDSAISWLKMVAPSLKVSITGGKALAIQNRYFQESTLIPEFQATCEGARFLLTKENKSIEESYLVLNIGTGTSWHLVNGAKAERILGSGMGGGTFTGLGSLLTKVQDYQLLTVLAEEGNKGNVDMLVKDIYETADSPIHGDLTAANFAKGKKRTHKEADRLASLSNMIAETIVLLTSQAATIHQVKSVVIIGTAIIGNPSLKHGLEYYFNMLGLTTVFLEKGEYCGAIGAFLSV